MTLVMKTDLGERGRRQSTDSHQKTKEIEEPKPEEEPKQGREGAKSCV